MCYHYRTGLVCRVSNTLDKGPFALGKGFAECGKPHSVKKITVNAPLPSVFFRALGKKVETGRANSTNETGE